MKKLLGIMGALALVAIAPARSEAVTVTDAFLFSDWTAPTNVSNPPFAFTPIDGVKLTLNGSGVATSFADVNAEGPFDIDPALTYQKHTGTVNPGEGFAQTAVSMGPRVNSEVGTLDDVGIFNEGTDEALNVDFNNNSTVTFALPAEGITRLMVAEDAGLDPFKLELCSDAACTTPVTLFNGLNAATRTGVLARADFDSCDGIGCAIDQVYIFVFDSTATGFLRVSESDNFGQATLEIDFIGGAIPQGPPPVIPEPASLLLFGLGGLGAVGFRGGKKSRKS